MYNDKAASDGQPLCANDVIIREKESKPLIMSTNQPPIDMLVIGTATGSSASPPNGGGNGGFFISPCPSKLKFQSDNDKSESSQARPTSFPNGSFKLQPRNPFASVCTPSPSEIAARGRKRRAHSMSSPKTTSQSSEEGLDPSPQHSLANISTQSPGTSEPNQLAPTMSPILTMKTLSLQSPSSRKFAISSTPFSCPSPMSSLPSIGSLPLHRPRSKSTSGFSAYASSPASSIKTSIVNQSESLASGMTSTKSSPRQIPLTVLSDGRQDSPFKTPRSHRKLLGTESLLISLDRQPPVGQETYLFSPTTKDIRKAGEPLLASSWPGQAKFVMSPSVGSPLRRPRAASSPRTPLPKKIALTPRTPSSGDARNPLSSNTDGVFTLDSIAPFGPTVTNEEMGNEMDDLLQGFATTATTAQVPVRASHQLPSAVLAETTQRNMTATEQDECLQRKMTPHAINCEDNQNSSGTRSKLSTPMTRLREPQGFLNLEQNNRSSVQSEERWNGEDCAGGTVEMRSLFQSSGSADPFSRMLQRGVRAGGTDAETGSLSPSDDEGFVLASPSLLNVHKESMNRGSDDGPVLPSRARRRRRCGENCLKVEKNPSSLVSMVDASGTSQSQTSLLGLDIPMAEDGTDSNGGERSGSGSSSARTTPFSLSSAKLPARRINRKDSATPESSSGYDSLSRTGCFPRGQSNQSLTSCEISSDVRVATVAVEGIGDRDLVTPPTTIQNALNPPPLLRKGAEATSTTIASFENDFQTAEDAI